MTKLRDFLRIAEAAADLGVSARTWERAGTIAAYRHPVHRDRLFQRRELDAARRTTA